MSSPSVEFFEHLCQRGHERLLEPVNGRIRVDVSCDHQTDHWVVQVTNGDIRVSREEGEAACVVHVDEPAIAEHLLGPRLFSGWGTRTMATGEARYNPIGYHVGTVWPFDNSIIAWGLRRYGFSDEAGHIAAGMLDAAEYLDGRLPEAFAGYDRDLTKHPVR